MGIYIYNEEKYLNETVIIKNSIVLSDKCWEFLLESARFHKQFWNDERRRIMTEIECKYENEISEIVQYSKNLSNELWCKFMVYLDNFFFEGGIWCDVLSAASEEQKDYYFEHT